MPEGQYKALSPYEMALSIGSYLQPGECAKAIAAGKEAEEKFVDKYLPVAGLVITYVDRQTEAVRKEREHAVTIGKTLLDTIRNLVKEFSPNTGLDEAINQCAARLEHLSVGQSRSYWMKISDGLPDKDDQYLIRYKDGGDVRLAIFSAEYGSFLKAWNDTRAVYQWCEIPK
jgi:hypothetical protein